MGEGQGQGEGQSYTIGEIAARSGLTARTLRLLEDKGVLVPGRAPNGYRIFTERQLELASAVRDMRAAGLSGEEIARIIAVKSARVPSKDKYAELVVLLKQVEERLEKKKKAVAAAIRIVAGYRRSIEEKS
jgi:DNA-binding transcriptional MerR regulator